MRPAVAGEQGAAASNGAAVEPTPRRRAAAPPQGSASSAAGRIRAGGGAEGHGAQLAVWLALAALIVAASVRRGWRPLDGRLGLGALGARLSAALRRCQGKTDDDWIAPDRRAELDARCVCGVRVRVRCAPAGSAHTPSPRQGRAGAAAAAARRVQGEPAARKPSLV